MEKSIKGFYWTVLFLLLIISAYPVYLGIRVLVLHFQNTSIQPEDYAHLVIPYAAVCSSLLITTILYPLLSKLPKYSVAAASILGLGLFAVMEWYIEGLTIFAPKAQSAFQWQLVQNIGITDTTLAFHKLFDNTYRIHYLVVSLLLILLVTDMVYSYGRLISSKDRPKKISFTCSFFNRTLYFTLYCFKYTLYPGRVCRFYYSIFFCLTISFFFISRCCVRVYLAGFL